MLKLISRSALASVLLLILPALAQEPQDVGRPDRGAFAGMQRQGGEITSIEGSSLRVKTPDGSSATIVTTTNTRILRGSGAPGRGMGDVQPIQFAELKVGDGIMAMGQLDAPNHTLHAAMLFATDAAVLKAMRENLGKTYISGKVTAIDMDNAKLTVQRADGVSQTIGLDENTSFRRGRGRANPNAQTPPASTGESITLADIKVGDNVYGQGSLKNGTFVPHDLTVSAPGAHLHGTPVLPNNGTENK